MSLLDEIHAATAPGGPRCTVCVLLTELPDADAADLAAALADRSIPGTAIARALAARDHHMRGNTVNRHRNEHMK